VRRYPAETEFPLLRSASCTQAAHSGQGQDGGLRRITDHGSRVTGHRYFTADQQFAGSRNIAHVWEAFQNRESLNSGHCLNIKASKLGSCQLVLPIQLFKFCGCWCSGSCRYFIFRCFCGPPIYVCVHFQIDARLADDS